MQEQIDNMEVKIDKMYDAFVGSELNDNSFMKRIARVEKYQSKDKKQKWMVAGIALTLGTLSKFSKEVAHIFGY